jgi:hypothetical protein
LSGFAFRCATSSATLRAGTLGWTNSAKVETATSDTGAYSASEANGGDFCSMGMAAIEAIPQSRTEPSAGTPARACAASVPLAPGRLSMTTVRPVLRLSAWPKARAAVSEGPPAPVGRTMRIG